MRLTRNLKFALVLFIGLSIINCVSVRPIYNADEQAKAERGVKEFHKLYNEQNFEGIYNLLTDEARQATNKENFLTIAKQGFEKFGKIQNASLSEAKVLPSTPVQVRMIYNVKLERGDAQEWFVWVTDGDKTRLLSIQTFPGFDKPDSKK